MIAKYKFPAPTHYGGNVYQKGDVDDWFKRCIEDHPVISEYLLRGKWKHLHSDRSEWFDKWFSQFRNKGEKK